MSSAISVVVPVKNGMPLLAETLDSIWAQEYAPIDVIIVDDGSTDNIRDFVTALRGRPVRMIVSDGKGPAAARNAGLRIAASELVAFLDADDVWPAGALHSLADALQKQPNAAFAQGKIQNFREIAEGHRQFVTPPYRYLNLGASLWRRSVFKQIGDFDEELQLCEDMDFTMRCWERDLQKVEIDSVVLHYRRHPGGVTHGLSGAGFGTVKAYKKRIDRIRRGEFDPALTRAMALDRYLGTPPLNQDGRFYVRAQ